MLQKVWAGENRRMTVCVDAYEDGVMKGRIVNAYQEAEPFGSMVQFLTVVEAILEDQQILLLGLRLQKGRQLDAVIFAGTDHVIFRLPGIGSAGIGFFGISHKPHSFTLQYTANFLPCKGNPKKFKIL